MKIAFTGSRHWKNEAQIAARLLELRQQYGEELLICHGDARNGVDAMVKRQADKLGIAQVPFHVESKLDGTHRRAPLNRNKRMLVTFKPNLLIAFRATGKSNGTDNTIENADKLDIPVEITPEDETDGI